MDSQRVMDYLTEVEVAAEDVLADKQQVWAVVRIFMLILSLEAKLAIIH